MDGMSTIAAEPAGPDEVVARASAWLDRQRTDAARAELAPALLSHPRHTGLLYESARADYLDDENDRAKETLGQLLAIEPDHPDARLLLAIVEEELGQLAAAEPLLLGLIRERPENAAYLAYYARLMIRALQFDKASALCDEALRLAPQSEFALRVRVLCDLASGTAARGGSAALAQLVVADPADWHTLRLVAVSLVQAGRSREALVLARELLRQRPRDAGLLELVKALRNDTHWSLIPMWPMQRWGWPAAIALWGGGIVVSRLLAKTAPALAGPFVTAWLAYAVYTWVWPPLLRRWLARGD